MSSEQETSDNQESQEEWLNRKDSVIIEAQAFVETLVGKLIRTMRLLPEFREDLISAGTLGLVEAAERYDPSRGVGFKTFAFFRIRGAIIDHMRQSCDLSGKGYRMFRALQAAHELSSERMQVKSRTASQIKSSEPSKDDAEKKFGHAIDYLTKSTVAYKLLYRGDYERNGVSEASHSNPDEHLEKKRTWEKVSELLATLPDKERTILEGYYLQGLKFVEVAESHAGLSKSWVSRLHDRGLAMLRSRYLEGLTEEERRSARAEQEERV